jgi:hypothetical protein
MTSTHILCRRTPLSDERGVALVIALMVSSLLMALAGALLLTTMTERKIAGGFGRDAEARYAAEAAIERVVPDLAAAADWDVALTGAALSSFVDGAPGGIRALPGGGEIDLTEATNAVRCGASACSAADLIASTEQRPWGANNPVWQLYAYGPLDRMLPAGGVESLMYVVVWIADDSAENDGDPLHDGGTPPGCDPDEDPVCADSNAGRGLVEVLARGIGPDGTRRSIAATLERRNGTRIVSWRDVR